MNFADKEDSRRYCIRGWHAALICAVVVAVGLIVGLSVGLTRSCPDVSTTVPGPPHSTAAPPQDQSACPASEDASGPWTNFRLPDSVVPEHYDLELQPELEQDTYTGNVTITLRLQEPRSYLWLHVRDTKVTRVPQLYTPAGAQVRVSRCFEYKAQEFLVLQTAEQLPATQGNGLYRLRLEFAGRLDGSLVGFYRTTYVEDGQVK